MLSCPSLVSSSSGATQVRVGAGWVDTTTTINRSVKCGGERWFSAVGNGIVGFSLESGIGGTLGWLELGGESGCVKLLSGVCLANTLSQ
jgi:hypothetical protein